MVLPVFNEQENLPELCHRLQRVLESEADDYEVIMVDDGSTDDSWQVIRSLHQENPRFKGIRFSRNFGQHIAFTAGLEASDGDAVVIMDADGQEAPEDIPMLLEKMREGYHVVYGLRSKREDSGLRAFISKLFLKILSRMAGQPIPEQVGAFRVMSRQVVNEFMRFPERRRFITGLVPWLGFPWAGVEVVRHKRTRGSSKYNLLKMIGLALDALISFSYFPLRVMAVFGLVVSSLMFLWAMIIIAKKIFFGIPVPGYASTMLAVLFMGGVQLLVMGMLGEYIGRIYQEVQSRPLYVVLEKTKGD